MIGLANVCWLKSQNQPFVGWYSPVCSKTTQPKAKGYIKPISIPLRMSGNLMLIEADVDGVSGFFIFDTGAPYLVLNNTYFRDYPHEDEYVALGINNIEVDIFRTRVQQLKIRNLVYEKLEADVADLSHLENSRGVKILGLLGTNLFTDFVIGINISEQYLIIHSPSDFSKEKQPAYNVIPFRLKDNIILISGSMSEVPLNFVFDTGAEINVLDHDLPDKAYQPFIIQRRNKLSGSVGNTIEVFAGITQSTKIGSFLVLQMKTIMTNLEGIEKVYDVEVDGIIGYEFLVKVPVIVDFSAKEIKLPIQEFYD